MKRREIFDPVATSLVHDLEEMSKLRKLPKRARETAIRRQARNDERIKKERERQAARLRITADIPPDIYSEIVSLADKHRISASGLISLACFRLLSDIDNGLNLDEYKVPSKSPKYMNVIAIPKISK